MLPDEYLLAKIGFDTAENEPFNFHDFGSLQGFNFYRAVVSVAASFAGSTLANLQILNFLRGLRLMRLARILKLVR